MTHLEIKGKIIRVGIEKSGLDLLIGEHSGLFSTPGKILIKFDEKALFDLCKHKELDEGELMKLLNGKPIEILIR